MATISISIAAPDDTIADQLVNPEIYLLCVPSSEENTQDWLTNERSKGISTNAFASPS
jgi:hypothetical protein